MLHLTNPCAKQMVLSLTKPKGKIYKTKSLGHYITLLVWCGSLDASLVGFSFAVAVDGFGSVSGELSPEEFSRLFSVLFLIFIGDGRGKLSAALSKFSIFLNFVSLSLWLGSQELELSERGRSLTKDASVCLILFFWYFWLLVILMTGDLMSDDLEAGV